jgi:P-type Cu+ transporter
MATDPICGMFVDERTAELKLVRGARTYYFCSTACLQQFAEPERELSSLRRRLLVAWPLSIAVVILTYFVPFPGGSWLAFGLTSVVQFYPGLPFYRGLVDAARSRVWNMDVLVAIATSTAYAFSVAALIDRALSPTLYFDASSLIVTLILTGNYLEHFVRERARGAVRRLGELLPATALVVEGDQARAVPVTEVRAGDRIRVLPGARFPADGTVRAGRSSVNEALMTGESLPVPKRVGDSVLAGSVNGEGVLTVEADRVGTDTFLSEIGRLLTEAESSRVPLQRLADRIAAVFVPVVLVLAALAAVSWLVLASVGGAVALLVFVSVVITACPCAFGIATPAALVVGTGRAAEEGVLFKGSSSIEAASEISVMLTDKTGTLTQGTPTLTDVVPVAGESELELLAVAAGLEIASSHPFARAVLEAARTAGATPIRVDAITVMPGQGVQGERAGRTVTIRSGAALGPVELADGQLSAAAARLTETGRAWSVVTEGGRTLGLLAFADRPAEGAREGVRALRDDGIEVVMVTGDHEAAARRVAEQVGIREVHAGVSPEGKLRLIRDRQARGERVAYVGDGINDAPALAQADLGIAIGAGTDVTHEAGGVVLVRSDFRDVARALRIGRRTVRKVRGNLTWALGYNAILLPIAAGAIVPWLGLGIFRVLPIAGAVAMALSSTLVVLNSYSLRWTAL